MEILVGAICFEYQTCLGLRLLGFGEQEGASPCNHARLLAISARYGKQRGQIVGSIAPVVRGRFWPLEFLRLGCKGPTGKGNNGNGNLTIDRLSRYVHQCKVSVIF